MRTSASIGLTACVLAGCSSKASRSPFTTDVLEITDISVPIPNLPEQYRGVSLAFISDIHHGQAIAPEWIERIVSAVNAKGVDLVLLGGDYIWIPESALSKVLLSSRNRQFDGMREHELPDAIYSDLFQALGRMNSTYGTFGVMGNHDRWISPALCQRRFHENAGELLVNQRTVIPTRGGAGTIEIFGADDYWNGLPKLPDFSADPNSLKIFVTHNPDHVIERCQKVIPRGSLVLCGHTHGGQICFPFHLGAPTYNVRSRRYGHGLHRLNDSVLYTTRGIGVVEIPHRINCPQELVFITLS